MNRFRVATPVLAALATLVMISSGARPAFAADVPRESVVVTGTGEVFGTPDTLTTELAVETIAATVGDALDRAGAAAGRMRAALVRAGVARADLQTSNVSVTSQTDDDRKIVGYAVSQGLTATIRDLPRAGALMSAAIAAGGDAARLNGVSFAIEDDTALVAAARKKAFADARTKAELYAREAGRTLDRVVRISEVAPSLGVPGAQFGMDAGDSRFAIEPGRLRLTATVTVEWALRL